MKNDQTDQKNQKNCDCRESEECPSCYDPPVSSPGFDFAKATSGWVSTHTQIVFLDTDGSDISELLFPGEHLTISNLKGV